MPREFLHNDDGLIIGEVVFHDGTEAVVDWFDAPIARSDLGDDPAVEADWIEWLGHFGETVPWREYPGPGLWSIDCPLGPGEPPAEAPAADEPSQADREWWTQFTRDIPEGGSDPLPIAPARRLDKPSRNLSVA